MDSLDWQGLHEKSYFSEAWVILYVCVEGLACGGRVPRTHSELCKNLECVAAGRPDRCGACGMWDGGGGTGGQQSTELQEEMRLTLKSLGWARAERAGNLPCAKLYLLEPSSKKWVPYQEIRFVTYKRLCSPRVCRQGGPNKALASRSRSFTWTALHR